MMIIINLNEMQFGDANDIDIDALNLYVNHLAVYFSYLIMEIIQNTGPPPNN